MNIMPFPLQLARLTELQRAVSEHFNTGGSVLSVILVIASIVLLVATVAILTRRQEERLETSTPSDPQKLFRDLVVNLSLNVQQRSLLANIAKDLELRHPTILLISSRFFEESVRKWHEFLQSSGVRRKVPDEQFIERLYQVLFPQEYGTRR